MSLELNNRAKIPLLGFGMWQSDNPQELETALDHALDAGYRHFDTAWGYRNEDVFGRVMKRWFESGKVAREELFITTKLPPTGNHPDRMESFLLDSLKSLQLTYVDLYLIHNPASLLAEPGSFAPKRDAADRVVPDTSATLEEIWKKMEEQVGAGRCKAIGLSNFSAEQVQRICKGAKIMPANHQIELNAYYPKKEMRKVCAQYGITIAAFAPLGSPGRKLYPGYPKIGADKSLRIPPLFEDERVKKLAKKHGRTPAQILLRFLVQQNIITIVKSVSPTRILENFDIFSFKLEEGDMIELDELDQKDERGTWGFDWKLFLPGIEDHPEF